MRVPDAGSHSASLSPWPSTAVPVSRPAAHRILHRIGVGVRPVSLLALATTHVPAFNQLACVPAVHQSREDRRLKNYREAEAQIILLPASAQADPLEVEVLAPLAGERGGTNNWQQVVGLCAMVAVICSVDRAAMSVALGPMGALHPTSYTRWAPAAHSVTPAGRNCWAAHRLNYTCTKTVVLRRPHASLPSFDTP